MRITELTNILNVIKLKNKKGIPSSQYKFKINSYGLRIFSKLTQMKLLNYVKRVKGGFATISVNDLLDIKCQRYPTTVVSYKNYPQIYKNQIRNDPYCTLIISTSKYGLLSLQQVIDKKTGGYMIAKVKSKKECQKR
jgi:ribosomal protein S8